MAELKFEIIKSIGVLSESSNGWKKEVNIVSWNGGDPKYDIRSWNQDRTKMGKGVTLSSTEIEKLRELLEQSGKHPTVRLFTLSDVRKSFLF